MGRKSREKRERRALQQGLSGIEEVIPINWARVEVLINRMRKDDLENRIGSFDAPAEPEPLAEADVKKAFERFTSRL